MLYCLCNQSKGGFKMIINISYDANISDEDFETLKSELEANSDEEFIGFYKGLIKA